MEKESEILGRARRYEVTAEKKIEESDRPLFHLSTRCGWMNDPNGFCRYHGEYHMFYQYHPYSTDWGPMHWGHAVSSDLLHWKYLPAALAPDAFYDAGGCFSGSALTLPDGRHLLMYTGVSGKRTDEEAESCQTQCIAVGDGIEYQKYEHNPVIDGKNLPEGFSRADFRDPKILQEKDGSYTCIIGNRAQNGNGQLLQFRSEDALSWRYDKILIRNDGRFGRMWECPDYFDLDGKKVLLTSPQDMLPEPDEFAGGNGTLCLIGNTASGEFRTEAVQTVDFGIDFYAMQTVEAEDGRRIMIGWMQNWDTCMVRRKDAGWFGQMSLPRELHLKNRKLLQSPVRELEQMHGRRVRYTAERISDRRQLDGICGRRLDLEMTIRPDENAEYNKLKRFTMRFAMTGGGAEHLFYSSLTYDARLQHLTLDRKYSGIRRAALHDAQCPVTGDTEELKLRIILDRYSAEVFVNDGQQVLTMLICTEQNADQIDFEADGTAVMNMTCYELV